MLVANLKPIQIIGFAESTVSQEAKHFISQEFFGGDVSIITPDEFLSLPDKTLFQYVIGFTIEVDLRKKIIETLEWTRAHGRPLASRGRRKDSQKKRRVGAYALHLASISLGVPSSNWSIVASVG
jgi:hypothetical protein